MRRFALNSNRSNQVIRHSLCYDVSRNMSHVGVCTFNKCGSNVLRNRKCRNQSDSISKPNCGFARLLFSVVTRDTNFKNKAENQIDMRKNNTWRELTFMICFLFFFRNRFILTGEKHLGNTWENQENPGIQISRHHGCSTPSTVRSRRKTSSRHRREATDACIAAQSPEVGSRRSGMRLPKEFPCEFPLEQACEWRSGW